MAGSDKNTANPKRSIYTQLRALQNELNAPKDQTGRFGKHRNVEGILGALKPLLVKYELTLTLHNRVDMIGSRYYVVATARLYYEPDAPAAVQTLEVDSPAWEGELSRGLDAPQVTGAASSYARKYALGGLFAIDDESKDPDSHMEPAKASPRATASLVHKDDDPVTLRQKQELKSLMDGAAMLPDGISMLLESQIGKTTVDTYGEYKTIKEALLA
jgi:hypothetical protein